MRTLVILALFVAATPAYAKKKLDALCWDRCTDTSMSDKLCRIKCTYDTDSVGVDRDGDGKITYDYGCMSDCLDHYLKPTCQQRCSL